MTVNGGGCVLQEALARQHALSAASSTRVSEDPVPRSGSPWDSAWDQQSAATRGLNTDLQGRLAGLSSARHRQHSQGVFGSIVNDYRPPIVQTAAGGVNGSHRYAHS